MGEIRTRSANLPHRSRAPSIVAVVTGTPTSAIRSLLIGLGALATLACLLTTDAARAAWIAPVEISQPGVVASQPQVAVDAAGNVTAVWTSGEAPNRAVRSAFRPAGGEWEPSFNRMTSTTDCHDPQLAVNPSGAAVVIADCEKSIAGTAHVAIRAAYRPGAFWSGAIEVPGSDSGKGSRVGIDDAGNAVAVWATGTTVRSAYLSAPGPWVADSGQVSTVGKLAFDPNVAMSPAGLGYAVWRENREGPVAGDPVVHVRGIHRVGDDPWSTFGSSRLTVDTGDGAVNPVTKGVPQITINADAERMIAWSRTGTKDSMQERTGFADYSGLSEPPQTIFEATAHVEVPQIALDAGGLGAAAWRSDAGGLLLIKAATTSSLSGAWSAPATLGGPDGLAYSTVPDVAAGPAGTGTVVWRAGTTTNAAKRTGPGAFGPASPISTATHTGFGEPKVTMSGEGDSVVAWSASGATPLHIAVAVDDVTPPVLSAIAAPSSVEVGAAAAMSASATDTWSSSSIAWDFGDGTAATGGSVSHAYATAGERTVTVTTTDAVGNTAAQTRAISVTPRPGEGGSGGGDGGDSAQKRRVALTATVLKQPWKKILEAKALRLRCALDPAGTCSAMATVSRQTARRLGLKPAKRARTASIGSGSIAVTAAGRPAILKVKLSGKALAAIEGATKSVPIALVVTGSAPQSEPASLSRALRIKRP